MLAKRVLEGCFKWVLPPQGVVRGLPWGNKHILVLSLFCPWLQCVHPNAHGMLSLRWRFRCVHFTKRCTTSEGVWLLLYRLEELSIFYPALF